MGGMSKRKGKTGERELSHKLTEIFGVQCRRNQQFCGAAGDADVVGLLGIHIESKRCETLSIYKAMEQAQADAKNGDVPTVFHRRNGKQWLVVCNLDDLKTLVSRLSSPSAGG